MAGTDELVAIGQIVKPFGVRGDVRVRSLSDVPGRFEGLREVTLVSPAGVEVATIVERIRETGGSYVVGFAAFSSPEQAAAFRGGLIKIPRSQSPALPTGQYYEGDLVGLRVMADDGRVLGTLEEVLEAGGNHVFVVRGDGRELLIPATKAMVASVDVAAGTMTVRGIDELLDDRGDERHAV